MYILWNAYKILYDYYVCVCVCVSGGGGGTHAGKCASVLLVLLRMDSIRVQYYSFIHWLYYALRTKNTSPLMKHDLRTSVFQEILNPPITYCPVSCLQFSSLPPTSLSTKWREVQREASNCNLFIYLFVYGLGTPSVIQVYTNHSVDGKVTSE